MCDLTGNYAILKNRKLITEFVNSKKSGLNKVFLPLLYEHSFAYNVASIKLPNRCKTWGLFHKAL